MTHFFAYESERDRWWFPCENWSLKRKKQTVTWDLQTLKELEFLEN